MFIVVFIVHTLWTFIFFLLRFCSFSLMTIIRKNRKKPERLNKSNWSYHLAITKIIVYIQHFNIWYQTSWIEYKYTHKSNFAPEKNMFRGSSKNRAWNKNTQTILIRHSHNRKWILSFDGICALSFSMYFA